MLRYTWIYIVAFVLAAMRVAGHRSESYQAVAHLFVGGLFTASWWQYDATWPEGGHAAMKKIWLGIVLSLIELACALWFRFAAS